MKTIFDAVNELKGDLNNTYLFDINNDVYLFHCIIDGDYVCSPFETDDTHEYICTRKDFNALVEEMTLGLDVNSVTHGDLYDYVNANKTILEKETKPDYKPLVYTQEMVDNGELPIVGMEFMGKGYAHNEYTKMWFKLEALGIYSGSVIAESCSEANEVQLYSEIKPIDNRTDEEKANDDILKLVSGLPTWRYKSKAVVEAIKAGNIHGLKWSVES
tara:strand:+ start:16956 stop:17603 length:648 start_codon:yes stop_codon:yes gene_type:complete